MRRLFADTFYWVAMLNRRDNWHNRVMAFTADLATHHLYTTEAVLDEYLAYYCAAGASLRQQAVTSVRRLLDHPQVTVMPQTRDVFLDGVSLYESRLDKEYSLTDCISMQVMRRNGLLEVLTNDRHFTQEGFQITFT